MSTPLQRACLHRFIPLRCRTYWSAATEAGPSRLPIISPLRPLVRYNSSAPPSPSYTAEDQVSSSDETNSAREAATATAESEGQAHSAERSQEDRRDPYSLSEDFLKDAQSINVDSGRIVHEATGGQGQGADDTQEREWLASLLPRDQEARLEEKVDQTPNAQPYKRPSLADSLIRTWNDAKPLSSPAPRIPKGVRDRHKRTQGVTMHEARSIQKALSLPKNYVPWEEAIGDMVAGMNGRSGSRGVVDYGRNGGGYGIEQHLLKGDRYGTKSAMSDMDEQDKWDPEARRHDFARRRLLQQMDEPHSDLVETKLEALKEEAGAYQTDVQLLDWARKRVFVTEQIDESGTVGFHPVYPHILGWLLKELRTRYQSPHLVLAVFSYAQNLSTESYISGCLAPAYNELLWTKWESFSDLQGIEATISEMEAAGVKWDKGTRVIIDQVVEIVGESVYGNPNSKKWGGKKAFQALANLDRKLQVDVNQQENIWALQKKEKARDRRYQRGGDGYRRPGSGSAWGLRDRGQSWASPSA